MKTRILSGFIMAPLLILIFLGGYFLLVGAFVISLLALREFYAAFAEDEKVGVVTRPAAWVGYLSIIVLYLYFVLVQIITPFLFVSDVGAENSVTLLGIAPQVPMLWVFFVLIIGFVSSFKMNTMNVKQALATLIGPLYIVFMAAHVYLTDGFSYAAEGGFQNGFPINGFTVSGFSSFVWVIVIGAFGTDICAYFTGMAIGKHKLCPSISPKKTIEGSIGGIAGSMILTWLYCHFLIPDLSIWDALLLGALMGVVSQLGDLSASVLKRKLNVKDWGHLIPGHGGVLDRIDSVLFTAPLVYYYLEIRQFMQNYLFLGYGG